MSGLTAIRKYTFKCEKSFVRTKDSTSTYTYTVRLTNDPVYAKTTASIKDANTNTENNTKLKIFMYTHVLYLPCMKYNYVHTKYKHRQTIQQKLYARKYKMNIQTRIHRKSNI